MSQCDSSRMRQDANNSQGQMVLYGMQGQNFQKQRRWSRCHYTSEQETKIGFGFGQVFYSRNFRKQGESYNWKDDTIFQSGITSKWPEMKFIT
mmetsp:Transcript_228/g.302  ORF Transcript_228/g.302 Transcript_228/m.302 type:complete len:93 (+) Transcript_228:125-403(+)